MSSVRLVWATPNADQLIAEMVAEGLAGKQEKKGKR